MIHALHRPRIAPLAIALALAFLFAGIAPAPVRADGAASTRNIILGAAALAAGIVIYNNVHHKALAHDTVVGRTRDGGTVYADGRVVYPNGDVLYTSNGNGRPCSYAGNYEACGGTPVAYYPAGYRHHDNGRHIGHYKHHHHSDEQGDEGEGRHGDD